MHLNKVGDFLQNIRDLDASGTEAAQLLQRNAKHLVDDLPPNAGRGAQDLLHGGRLSVVCALGHNLEGGMKWKFIFK